MTSRLIAAFAVISLYGSSAVAQTDMGLPSDGPKPEASQPSPDTSAASRPPEPTPGPDTPIGPHVNAGYGNGTFFVRSDDDNFILVPAGRFQYDFLGYQGGGSQAAGLQNGFFPRRARIETFGTIMKIFDFQLGAELTQATTPIFTDNYINANPLHNWFNIQLGQFDAPFTMENRTSDKWTDMQERSPVIRAFAIPENKEIGGMIWGQPTGKWAYYSLGLFNGEGQQVLPHRSNDFDFMGRVWFAPLGLAGIEPLKNVWIGGSLWEGTRSAPASTQVDRLSMSDTARFTFFNPQYTECAACVAVGAPAPAKNNIHLGDFGTINKWALELNVPFDQFVLKAEYVSDSEGIREVDTQNKNGVVRSGGTLSGSGYYVRLSYFIWGDPLINGLGGMQIPPSRLFGTLRPGKTETALQVVAEYDHIGFNYAVSDGSSGAGLTQATFDPLAKAYGTGIFGLGVNYWYTKHIRLTANFFYNTYTGGAVNWLPGTASAPNPNSYEITGRIALAF